MNVLGLIIGVATAGSASMLNVLLKKIDGVSPHFLTFIRMGAATSALALFVSLFSTWAIPPPAFWFLISVIVPLEIAFGWCITKAVQASPLSVVGPFTSFSSLFLIPVGFVVLGELPTSRGITGIAAIIAGLFFLGWRQEERLSSGWKNLMGERGTYFALAGALTSSFVVSATKASFQYAPPLLTAFYITAVLALVLSPIAYRQSRKTIVPHTQTLIGLWAVSSASIALHNTGLSLMQASYFISLKRLSVLLDVFFGKVIFKEEHVRERSIGAALMVVGVILIVLG